MKQRRLIAFTAITAFIVLFSAIPVFATWNLVLSTSGAHSGFFFNEFVGFIGSSGSDGIYKTTDGGKNWVKTIIPGGFTSGYITQIFMTDALRGWAAIEDFDTKQCLWITTDGGLTWKVKGPIGQYNNVFETPSAIIGLSRDIYGNSFAKISTDGGNTFANGQMKLNNGIDFVDASHGVVTCFTDTVKGGWMSTLDGGKTWTQINPIIRREAWSIYGVKGTSIFYTAAEGDPIAGRTSTQLMRSANYGATWTTVAPLSSNGVNFYSTGHIAGFGEMLYVQTDTDRSVNKAPFVLGMYRTIDKGLTWKYVGGPGNDRDTRFIVTGCNGGIIYAFDARGNVWKTRDGGDGQVQEPPIAPQIFGDPIVFSGPICSTSDASLQIQNLYCIEDSILSAELLDTTSAIISSGALKVTVMPSFPLLLAPNAKDSIRFTWQPFKLFHSDTTVTIKVKIKYFSKILGKTFDTTVTISVHAVGESPLADVAPTNLNFNTIPYCLPHDTTFIIRNNGCDTLFLLNASGSAPQYYVVLDSKGNPLQLPLGIPPSRIDTFIVRLNLSLAGSYSSNLLLKLRHQGIGKDTIINIAAVVSAKASYSLPDSVDFGLLSTCETKDSLIPIKNNGCVEIVITDATLQNNLVFSLVGTPLYTSPIPPGGTGFVHVRFSPNAQQKVRDIVTLSFTALGEPQTKQIILKGSGYFTAAKLVSTEPTDTLFNLKLTRCDPDTIFRFTLSNPGCDSITITSAQLTGNLTPDISLTLGSSLPVSINNGKNIGITVKVTPKDLGNFSGKLHVTYRIAKDNTLHDTLISYFLTVGYGSRILSLDHDTIDLGTMKLCDFRDSAVHIQNLGCDLLDILSINIQGQGNFKITVPPGLSPLISNQSSRIPFHFDPYQAEAITGTITITSVSDTRPIRIVTILARIIPTDTLTLSVLPTHNVFYAGDTFTVQLIPQQNVHGKGLRDAAFTLHFNSDLLTLLPAPSGINALVPNARYIAGPQLGTPKHSTIRIFLQGLPTLEIDSLKPVLEFKFYVSLTDSITTTFDLSDVQLNGGDTLYAKCDLGILSASLVYKLAYHCGDSTLVKFMQLGKNIKIFADAVYPNPVSEHNNFQAIIPFTSNISGLIGMKIYDQLGRMVDAKELVVSDPGKYQFSIDGSNLAGGCYMYILQEISSSSNIHGRFVITK